MDWPRRRGRRGRPLSDLYQAGLITVLRPATDAPISDLTVMRNVLDGLKAL